jgi:hypothetical protein
MTQTITVVEVSQGSDQWHDIRKNKITGSIADKLLSWHKGDAMKMNDNNAANNFYTKRGKILEVEALELYEQIHDCTIERPGFITNSAYPDCGCSPDAIDGLCLLEVKCFKENNHDAIHKLKEIPFKIMSQIQFNMMICNLPIARLIMYNPDVDDVKEAYREIGVPRMPKVIANLKRRLEATG